MSSFTIFMLFILGITITFWILYTNDVYYEVTCFLAELFSGILLICFALLLIFLVNKLCLKNNGTDYNKFNDKIFEIKSIINYGNNEYVVKDNTYYLKLISYIEDYNKSIDKELIAYNFYEVEIPKFLLQYQKMVYNYSDNTVLWEDGTSIMIEKLGE